MDMFSYITRSTHLRPRDYVKFLQACAEHETLSNRSRISALTVRKIDKAFSNYLRNEIVDETQAVLPDIDEILNILSEIRKQTFPQELFARSIPKEPKQDCCS